MELRQIELMSDVHIFHINYTQHLKYPLKYNGTLMPKNQGLESADMNLTIEVYNS